MAKDIKVLKTLHLLLIDLASWGKQLITIHLEIIKKVILGEENQIQ